MVYSAQSLKGLRTGLNFQYLSPSFQVTHSLPLPFLELEKC